ncbi:MAG TPA: hypothetical protein VJL28_13115 [Gemmatimonadaceae bacterium]|nr:hypothetical protein [Gemmatimonadaceae bacterium]
MVRPLICCALLAACAKSGATPGPDVAVTPVSARVVTSTGGGVVDLSRSAETVGVPLAVNARPDTVFAVLVAVYKELNIATTRLVPEQRVVGNDLFRARRRLGGAPMQSAVDCGGNPGQPNAETFDMELSIVSYVSATAAGTATITTMLAAVGNDPMFGKDRQMRCSSTGELERRIARMVRERLGLK